MERLLQLHLLKGMHGIAARLSLKVMAAGILVGCAYPGPIDRPKVQPPPALITTPAAAAKAYSGRIRLQWTDGSQPPLQANFTLEGDSAAGQLLLETPFGTALAAVGWHAQGAWLSKEGSVRHYHDRDRLFLAELGSDLPLDALLDWLAGQGSAGLSQSGWVVEDNQPTRRLQALRLTPSPSVRITIALDGSP